MHTVVALALGDVVAFDLSIPAQIFGHDEERGRYRFLTATPVPGAVASTTGFFIGVEHGLEALDAADTIVVPGFLPTHDPPAEVLSALQSAAARGARIASVCVGAFALAAAGLLDGRAATTHWEHADDLARRFPAVQVRPEVLYVDAGQVLTSAGIASGIDLCLHMVARDFGAEAGVRVSRRMVAARHRDGGQAQFIDRPLPRAGPLMTDVLNWAQAHLDTELSVAGLAARAGYAPRSFTRHFRAELGISPARWIIDRRILEARRLLEATDLDVESIARRCGLGSAANLRMHFSRATATTPTAYRRSFRGAAADRLGTRG